MAIGIQITIKQILGLEFQSFDVNCQSIIAIALHFDLKNTLNFNDTLSPRKANRKSTEDEKF